MKNAFTCPNAECGAPLPVQSLEIQLLKSLRSHINQFINGINRCLLLGWVVCDDSTCRTRTRTISVMGQRCLVTGCKGMMNLEVC